MTSLLINIFQYTDFYFVFIYLDFVTPLSRNLHFCIYHLLFWAAVRSAMPSFYEKMKTRLRSADEGADTVVWLAMSDAALSHPSGLFYQGINLSSNTLQLLCAQSFGQQHFRSFIIGKVTKYNRSSTEKPVITWSWMIHHKIIDTYILTVLYLYNYKLI